MVQIRIFDSNIHDPPIKCSDALYDAKGKLQESRPPQLHLELLDAPAQLPHHLGLLDRDLLHDLDEPPEPQDDDERRDLRRQAVLHEIHGEADDDDEGVQAVEPVGEVPEERGQFSSVA